MQNFSEIQTAAFDEIRNKIEEFSTVNSITELLDKEHLIPEIQELIHFLKISQRYLSSPSANSQFNTITPNEDVNENNQDFEKYIAEEEVIFNNELNEIEESAIDHPEFHIEELEEEAAFNNHLNEIDDTEHQEENQEEIILEDSNHPTELQENILFENVMNSDIQSIAELTEEMIEDTTKLSKEEKLQQLNEVAEEIQEQHYEEKKFRLANIKGLKKIQTLFEDEFQNQNGDQIIEKPKESIGGSLLKSNVPTDFMEAEKPKPEFKLDLNDRIAFTKTLFGGSQSELNNTINILNSFKTLEEAKEYLSDVYYKKNWEQSEEYAQRLWSLVENKFQ